MAGRPRPAPGRRPGASPYTADLYLQYRKHLGGPRYRLLRCVQGLVAPARVRQLLQLPAGFYIAPAVALYRSTRHWRLSQWARNAMLPAAYRDRIRALDAAPVALAGPAVALPPARRCPMH